MEAPFLHISLGNILTVVATIGSIAWFIIAIRNSVDLMGLRLSTLEDSNKLISVDLRKLAEVVVDIARQEERLNSVDQRLNLTGQRLDQLITRVDGISHSIQVRSKSFQIDP